MLKPLRSVLVVFLLLLSNTNKEQIKNIISPYDLEIIGVLFYLFKWLYMSNFTDHQIRFANLYSFMVLGILESSWAPMIPYIKDRFMLDEGSLGLLLLCLGVGSFCALPLVGSMSAKLGCKALVYISGILMALSLFLVAISQNLYLTGALLFIFGMSTIGIDIGSNVNAVMVENELKRPLMSGFHGGYSLGTLLGAFLVSAMLSFGLNLIFCALAVFTITLFLVFGGCRALYNKGQTQENEQNSKENDNSQKYKAFFHPLVIIVGLLCFVMYSTEGAVMSWSAVFAHQERNLEIEYAGFIYTAFACAMTIMRLVGNRLVEKIGRRKTVVIGALLVSIGFATTVIVANILGTILGFVLIGFGAANIVPQLVSFGAHIKGVKVHIAISIINALGYSGILAGPVIIGFIANNFSIATAFSFISLLVLVVALTSFKILRRSQI